jgi:hypothetical protein
MTELKPSSLSHYIATLRQVLDFAGVEPNPARDRRVKLPREWRRHQPPTRVEISPRIWSSLGLRQSERGRS